MDYLVNKMDLIEIEDAVLFDDLTDEEMAEEEEDEASSGARRDFEWVSYNNSDFRRRHLSFVNMVSSEFRFSNFESVNLIGSFCGQLTFMAPVSGGQT